MKQFETTINDYQNMTKDEQQKIDTINQLEFIQNQIKTLSFLIVDSNTEEISQLFFLLCPIEQNITQLKEELMNECK